MAEASRQGAGSAHEGARDRAHDVRLVASGILGVLLVWFAFANLQDVHIDFWLWSTRAPLIVVIAVSGFLGAVVAGLVSRQRRGRQGSKAG